MGLLAFDAQTSDVTGPSRHLIQEVGRFLVGASLLLFRAPHPPLISVSQAGRQPDWDANRLLGFPSYIPDKTWNALASRRNRT
jgi:hypothetical protein